MKIKLSAFRKLIEENLISVQRHPEHKLWIFNYTQKCQFGKAWVPETRMARGLIVDEQENIVARPFDKFFNMEETPNDIPQNVKFSAYDKADGSLGIMYPIGSGVALATRGSFTSEQAVIGTEMLHEAMNRIEKSGIFKPYQMTYLFEIIYPENRIVIDYKGEKKLVFLGARDIETGKVYTPDWFPDICQYFETVKTIEEFAKPRENAEGVVLYYENGFMCKVKYDEYVRLHRLVTGVTARRIWDILKNGGTVTELTQRVPEEFAAWVNKKAKALNDSYYAILDDAVQTKYRILAEIELRNNESDFEPDLTNFDVRRVTKKAFALEALKHKAVQPILFALFDQKPYSHIIWRMIEPPAEKPFKEDM